MKEPSTSWTLRAIGLCFLLPLGCGAAPERESVPQEEPAGSQDPLFGTLATSGCTAAQVTFAEYALKAGRFAAASGNLLSCLAQTIRSGASLHHDGFAVTAGPYVPQREPENIAAVGSFRDVRFRHAGAPRRHGRSQHEQRLHHVPKHGQW
jgi:hypothetical protein